MAAGLAVLVGAAGVVAGAEVVVTGGGVGEQVLDDHQDGAGDGDEGPELASALHDPPVALPGKVSVLAAAVTLTRKWDLSWAGGSGRRREASPALPGLGGLAGHADGKFGGFRFWAEACSRVKNEQSRASSSSRILPRSAAP
jgi:hypothetical protein